ncbi:nitrous oxide-stimulated promoter family protein [Thermogutta sp.]|uniref:nitrous oxide-stimulated promoter family protein n=1 Tax=Thermogutta sp. TaxID=1962930 RepID=UPI003220534F
MREEKEQIAARRSRRIERERRTIEAMIRIFCRKKHGQRTLCRECQELFAYAVCRLDKCPFGENKTTCARCPVHCYKPDMRERVRQVMRFSGPWMLLYHPYLTLRHYLDEWFIEPQPLQRRVGG